MGTPHVLPWTKSAFRWSSTTTRRKRPPCAWLYAMSDHSDEAYEAFRRLLTERHVAMPPPSAPEQCFSRRRQLVVLVRARVLFRDCGARLPRLAPAVVALVAAGASWRRSERCQQGAVLGTVIFLVMTGVVVGKGILFWSHHDTPSWISGISTVLLRHGGVSFVLAGWACVSIGICGVCDPRSKNPHRKPCQ